jgi:SAM-dependent methyltransferase
MNTESPFDTVAATYDRDFTGTRLGRSLRAEVHTCLAEAFKPGDRVLELNCGTGEDALWLARRGIFVTATDVSVPMLEMAALKAAAHGMEQRIVLRRLDLRCPGNPTDPPLFDGAFSNFGGLNCIEDLKPACLLLAGSIKPGGRLLLVVMGRWCMWEILWHLSRLQASTGFRRLRHTGVSAGLGADGCRVWYHSVGSIRRALGASFRCRNIRGVGVFLPPTYLRPAFEQRPHWQYSCGRLEDRLAARFPFSRWGDHLLLDFDKR